MNIDKTKYISWFNCS